MNDALDCLNDPFLQQYTQLKTRGKLVRPRGLLCLELEDHSYVLPPYVRFQNFAARKLNVKYIRDEFRWYLKGDRFDLSICEKAKIWQGIINSDGSINSNYGQYIFHGDGNQFDNVVRTLASDPDSRRASMTILDRQHLLSDTKDVPCTYALNFRLRDGKLNMSVLMRSQDALYGMASDAPCFSFIQEMVLEALREHMPNIQCGTYFHHANSFHAYERHFKMLDELTNIFGPGVRYEHVDCPRISGPDEVRCLRALHTMTLDELAALPERFAFAKWLIA